MFHQLMDFDGFLLDSFCWEYLEETEENMDLFHDFHREVPFFSLKPIYICLLYFAEYDIIPILIPESHVWLILPTIILE